MEDSAPGSTPPRRPYGRHRLPSAPAWRAPGVLRAPPLAQPQKPHSTRTTQRRYPVHACSASDSPPSTHTYTRHPSDTVRFGDRNTITTDTHAYKTQTGRARVPPQRGCAAHKPAQQEAEVTQSKGCPTVFSPAKGCHRRHALGMPKCTVLHNNPCAADRRRPSHRGEQRIAKGARPLLPT